MIYYITALLILIVAVAVFIIVKRKKPTEAYIYEIFEEKIEDEDREVVIKEAIKLYKNKHKKFG